MLTAGFGPSIGIWVLIGLALWFLGDLIKLLVRVKNDVAAPVDDDFLNNRTIDIEVNFCYQYTITQAFPLHTTVRTALKKTINEEDVSPLDCPDLFRISVRSHSGGLILPWKSPREAILDLKLKNKDYIKVENVKPAPSSKHPEEIKVWLISAQAGSKTHSVNMPARSTVYDLIIRQVYLDPVLTQCNPINEPEEFRIQLYRVDSMGIRMGPSDICLATILQADDQVYLLSSKLLGG
jgi:hypothetical protein